GLFGLSARKTKQWVQERLQTFVTLTSADWYSTSPKSVGSRNWTLTVPLRSIRGLDGEYRSTVARAEAPVVSEPRPTSPRPCLERSTTGGGSPAARAAPTPVTPPSLR